MHDPPERNTPSRLEAACAGCRSNGGANVEFKVPCMDHQVIMLLLRPCVVDGPIYLAVQTAG